MADEFDPGMTPEQEAEFDKAVKEKLKIAALMKKVFSTDDGKQVLSYLRSVYVENCKWNPKLDVLDSIRWGFIREGQAMVVNSIEENIEYFNKQSKEQK